MTKVKSSGIIDNFVDIAEFVGVKVANLDPDSDRTVQVQVFNWNNNTPVALPVISMNGPTNTPGGGGPIQIEPNTSAVFTAPLNGVIFYEVRITFFDSSEDVVVTSHGKLIQTNAVGQTVLDKDFKTVELD